MLSATRFSLSDNLVEMNQDESSAPQLPSKSSKLKASGSSKSSTETPKEKLKREKDKKESSTETPKEEVKRKREKKERKKEKEEKKESKAKKPEQVIHTATPDCSKTVKKPEQIIPSANPYLSTKKDKPLTETLEAKLKRKREKNDKKERKKKKEERKKSKAKDSSETPEEKAQRRKKKKDKKERKKEEMVRMVKVLQNRVEEVESENHHIHEENTEMQDSVSHLNQAEEQLEYATEENHEFSARVHGLEQALVVQEIELDNALATIRKQVERKGKTLETENAADSVVGDAKKEKEAEKGNKTDSFADDAELACRAQLQLAYRKELHAVQEEFELMRHERDVAIDRAIKSKIETAKLKAEVSESYDRVTECKVVIEEVRTLWQNSLAQQSKSASVCSVSKEMDRQPSTSRVSSFSALPISIKLSSLSSLWGFSNKDDDKSIVSNYDDNFMLDQTEENNDEGSEEDWDLEQTGFPEQSSVVFC
jgi:hypothetical protein